MTAGASLLKGKINLVLPRCILSGPGVAQLSPHTVAAAIAVATDAALEVERRRRGVAGRDSLLLPRQRLRRPQPVGGGGGHRRREHGRVSGGGPVPVRIEGSDRLAGASGESFGGFMSQGKLN